MVSLILIILFAISLIILVFIVGGYYIRHYLNTKNDIYCMEYDFATFEDFRGEFKKEEYEWKIHKEYVGGLFNIHFFNNYYGDRWYKSKIYKGAVIFSKKGMVMKNPIEYLKMKLFVFKYYINKRVNKRNEIKKLKDKREKGLWGDDNE